MGRDQRAGFSSTELMELELGTGSGFTEGGWTVRYGMGWYGNARTLRTGLDWLDFPDCRDGA